MKHINKSLVLFSVLTLTSSMAQAGPAVDKGLGKGPVFTKMSERASFIYGDDLITGVVTESGVAGTRSMPGNASRLDAVMVTPNGDMYESKMDPKDAAVLKNAIIALESAGYSSAIFSTDGVKPNEFGHITAGIFGGETDVGAEVVIGSDNRVQITNTVTYPNYYFGRISVGCTGTLISAKHVLTAGHCVSDGNGSWYSNLDFSVAQNGSYKPWGTSSWTRAITTSQWLNSGDFDYDYGLIVLADAPHGAYAGWGAYSGGTHSITGYPGDKPFGTMWTHSGSVSTSGAYRLCYTIDTAGGQSGSAIADSNGYVRGVHTTGSPSQNCGTRMTSTVYNQLKSWISSYPD